MIIFTISVDHSCNTTINHALHVSCVIWCVILKIVFLVVTQVVSPLFYFQHVSISTHLLVPCLLWPSTCPRRLWVRSQRLPFGPCPPPRRQFDLFPSLPVPRRRLLPVDVRGPSPCLTSANPRWFKRVKELFTRPEDHLGTTRKERSKTLLSSAYVEEAPLVISGCDGGNFVFSYFRSKNAREAGAWELS